MAVSSDSPVISLGYESIDHDHQHFVELIEQLQTADNVTFPTLFKQLLTHTEQHFVMENELMQQSGHQQRQCVGTR